MFYHLFLTTQCNLACKYCFEQAVRERISLPFQLDLLLPEKFSCLKELANFLSKDPDPTIIFYGGEPLLALEEMKWIMDNIKARFILQTNGTMLDMLPTSYLSRLHAILVSIDGGEKTTDFFRGEGTFERILRNLRELKGFRGELIARMTVMEPVNIFEEVKWLLTNDKFRFSSVHWQLNAGFWSDFEEREFAGWMGRYNEDVRALVRWWVEQMRAGTVLKIYPLVAIVRSLLLGERSWLRCGAGHSNYAIQTDGNIIPCPAMWGMKDYYLGNIKYSSPMNLPKVFHTWICSECPFLYICGGRCMYAAVVRKWGENYRLVCETVKNLIWSVHSILPTVRELLKKNVIRLSQFDYLQFNGCEIIP